MENLKRHYIIKTKNSEDAFALLSSLHCQLRGNEDYINSNIVLNDDSTRRDGTTDEIHVLIFNECEEIPELIFK